MTDPRLIARAWLFLCGCIGARLLLTYIAYRIEEVWILGLLYLGISGGMLFYYFTGTRPTGPEVMGGSIWWNTIRPLHAFLYLQFAAFSFTKSYSKYAWRWLALDTFIGLMVFLSYSPASPVRISLNI